MVGKDSLVINRAHLYLNNHLQHVIYGVEIIFEHSMELIINFLEGSFRSFVFFLKLLRFVLN